MRTTVNGVPMSYTDEGKGQAVAFIHGFPLSRKTWQKQVEGLRSVCRVIAPDLRGLGETKPYRGAVTMAVLAGDVHGLLSQLAAEPAVVVGHSMGGYIALAFARQYPAMVKGLVLVGTRAGPDTAEAAAGRRATAEKVKGQGVSVVVEAMAAKMLSPGNTDAGLAEQVRRIMGGSSPEGVANALVAMADRPDSTAGLGDITAPTLVVVGADDVLIPPAESEKMAKAIGGAELKVIPGAGHLVACEQAEAFNLVLKDWLMRKGLTEPTEK